jgi:hypothetical protein
MAPRSPFRMSREAPVAPRRLLAGKEQPGRAGTQMAAVAPFRAERLPAPEAANLNDRGLSSSQWSARRGDSEASEKAWEGVSFAVAP